MKPSTILKSFFTTCWPFWLFSVFSSCINLTVLGRVKVIPNIEYYTCRLLSEGGIFYHRKPDWRLLVQNSLAAASIDKSIFIDLGKPLKVKAKNIWNFPYVRRPKILKALNALW